MFFAQYADCKGTTFFVIRKFFMLFLCILGPDVVTNMQKNGDIL